MSALMASVALGVKRIERDRRAASAHRRAGRRPAPALGAHPPPRARASSPRPSPTAPIASPTRSTPTAMATARSRSALRADARERARRRGPLHLRRHRDRRRVAGTGQPADEPRRAGHGARACSIWAAIRRRSATPAARRRSTRCACARARSLWPQVAGAARHARPHPDARARGAERAGQRRRRQGAGRPLGLCHRASCAAPSATTKATSNAFLLVRRHRRRLWRAALCRRHRRRLLRRPGKLSRRIPRDRLSRAASRYGVLVGFRRRRRAIAAAAASSANTRSSPRRRAGRAASTASKIRPGASMAAWGAAPAASSSIPAPTGERVLKPLSDGNKAEARRRAAHRDRRRRRLWPSLRPAGRGGGWRMCSAALSAARQRARLYGVVLVRQRGRRAPRRRALRAERPPTRPFHRHEYVDVLA